MPERVWNGAFISFCPGFTSDDVTGHEWTHAYTEYTHGLIYEFQSGALNESYSDIFGETIDRINGRDAFPFPNSPRSADACSTVYGAPPPILTITGGSAAGNYPSLASAAEPPLPLSVGPTAMAIVATAAPAQPTGACGAVSGVSGKIAIIDWTLLADGVTNECGSVARATNAFNAGATGIIFKAPAAGLLSLTGSASIASVEVTHEDGEAIKAGLPAHATLTLQRRAPTNPARWLIGEDDTNPQLFGALRDMWNPRCFGNPGKVSDAFEYVCDLDQRRRRRAHQLGHSQPRLRAPGRRRDVQRPDDQGIGLTKAAHIYFRRDGRLPGFRRPTSADHADAHRAVPPIDLLGAEPPGPESTGAPSGQRITGSTTSSRFKQGHARRSSSAPEPPCDFDEPQLGQDPPPPLPVGPSRSPLLRRQLRRSPSSTGHGWTVTHDGADSAISPSATGTITSELPGSVRQGVLRSRTRTTPATPYTFTDQTVVLHLESPGDPAFPAGADSRS